MILKLALLQLDTQWENKSLNLTRASQYIHSADADLVVMPEMFTTGFTMNTELVAETMNGETVQWFLKTARESGKALMGSVVIAENDDHGVLRYYNRLLFASPEGELIHYDKKHLFRMGTENENYTNGKRRVIINYKGFRILPLVCYDLRFPVWSRNRGDYDLIIYTACWPVARAMVWSTLIRARAIENLAYVGGVNMVGRDPDLEYTGNSAIIDFMGNPLVESVESVPQLLTAVLDMDKLTAFRNKFPAHLDADKFTLD